MSTTEIRPFLSVKHLAIMLSVSEHTVRNMLNRGDLPWFRIGSQRRVDPADLAAVSGHSVQTATARYTHALHRSDGRIRELVG